MKHAVLSLFLCALIVVVGYAATKVAVQFRQTPMAAAATKTSTTKVTSVNVKVLKPVQVDDQLVLTGTVEPWEDIIVSAEGRGLIGWQGVKEGDVVRKGQDLVHIDTSLARAQLEQAQAQERLATQELQRAENLSTKGIATGQALDKTKADRDVASASVRLIKIQLDKSVVMAPFDGIIDKRFKNDNEFVDFGAPLFRLVQIHKVKVHVGIPERDIAFFKNGDAVTVRLDALPEKEFMGKIYQIATSAETSSLTFVTEIEVDNADKLIKPGMITRVTLVRRSFPNSIIIPIFAILSLENQRFVLVEQGGIAQIRPIEVGVLQGDRVQVTQGLTGGDRLIVTGQRDLKDGDAVHVLEVLE